MRIGNKFLVFDRSYPRSVNFSEHAVTQVAKAKKLSCYIDHLGSNERNRASSRHVRPILECYPLIFPAWVAVTNLQLETFTLHLQGGQREFRQAKIIKINAQCWVLNRQVCLSRILPTNHPRCIPFLSQFLTRISLELHGSWRSDKPI